MPSNVQAVAAVLLAVVPGYLAVAVWARTRTWRAPWPGRSSDLGTVLLSLTASAVVQVVAAPVTIAWILPHTDDLERFPERVATWSLLVVLVLPILGGFAAGLIGSRLPFSRHHPSVWDWFITQSIGDGSYLIVEFQDGKRVAGVYAKGATAIASPDVHGVYLFPECVLDGGGQIVDTLPDSGGLLIPTLDHVRWVRVLTPEVPDGEQAS